MSNSTPFGSREELIGKAVAFTAAIEHHECDFDRGMKARIEALESRDGYFRLTCNFAEFKDANEALMKANYFDESGKPTLRWCDTKSYPKDCRESIYLSSPFPFVVVDEPSVVKNDPNAIRNQVWFEEMSRRLGSTQLTHAKARLDQLERIENQARRWAELLSKGHRETVEEEMHRLLG